MLFFFFRFFKNLTRLLDSIVEPLYSSMSRDAESIISRIHREDFGGSNKAPIGGRSSPTRGMQDTQTSSYILELSSKLRWMMREIIARMQCGEDSKDWCVLDEIGDH